MIKLLEKRFEELVEQLDKVDGTKHQRSSNSGGVQRYVDYDQLLNWRVKAKSLLSSACGADSQHFAAFLKAEQVSIYETDYDSLGRVKAVFLAAKEDYEGGYLTTIKNLVQAEVFDSELEQASELLEAGYVSAAAVVAGVVLETNLRNLCDEKGIASGKLDRMNADLAKSGIYNALVQKRITALAAIRNSAAHGNVQEFSREDVSLMILEIQRLISNWLS